ncbi:MAG: UTP--glucose-1-phosphate uridylyltransferase [Chloroflexi bacterium]|nr:UTP--glucose-1-phosphate uridylyltransferase [Chloroflexota bacterium]MBT9165684.1 UTP--glucose-1-phosphate uridylyltransferase [Chloroflexota bacterium]
MGRITQAIILAAGEGQRLKPFTRLLPKVMLPIAGKPVLQYVVEALAQSGIRRIVMVIGYRREQVQDYFSSGQGFGVEIGYAIQPQQLGTAHALRQARDLADERFLLVAGDNIIEPGTIRPLVNVRSNTMLIRTQEDVSKYGVVIVQDGLVREVIEKPLEKISNQVNTGIYAFNREVFDFLDDEVKLTAVIQRMIAEGRDILALETDGTWLDAVYPWDILKLNNLILSRISPRLGGNIEEGAVVKGLVSIGDGTIIRSNCYIVGPAVIGDDCEIGPSVCIFPSTSVGNGAVISPFSIVRNTIIGNNVLIGPGSSIQDSIIAPGTIIRSHFAARSGEAAMMIEGEYHQVKMGAIIGSYSEIGDSTIIQPGAIIGNHCRIKAMKVISENIPDGGLVV